MQSGPDAPCARDPYPDIIPSSLASSEGLSIVERRVLGSPGEQIASDGNFQVLRGGSDAYPAAALLADLEPGTKWGELACSQAKGAEQGLVKPEASSTAFKEGSWAEAAGGVGLANKAPLTYSSHESQGWGPTYKLEAERQVSPWQGGWGSPESHSSGTGSPCIPQEEHSNPKGPGPHGDESSGLPEQKREKYPLLTPPPPPFPGSGGSGVRRAPLSLAGKEVDRDF